MIIFIGDYVQLRNNFHGDDSDWLRVDDIEVHDILVLSTRYYGGVRVCASDDYIHKVKSDDVFDMTKLDEPNNVVLNGFSRDSSSTKISSDK